MPFRAHGDAVRLETLAPPVILRTVVRENSNASRTCSRSPGAIPLPQAPMHELSLAQDIVEQAIQAARVAQAGRVVRVHLTIGRLAGVEADALRFCFETVCRDTALEGARLEVREAPLVVWCAHCLAERTLPGIQSLRCPTCQTLCGEVRGGREMQIESLEVEP